MKTREFASREVAELRAQGQSSFGRTGALGFHVGAPIAARYLCFSKAPFFSIWPPTLGCRR